MGGGGVLSVRMGGSAGAEVARVCGCISVRARGVGWGGQVAGWERLQHVGTRGTAWGGAALALALKRGGGVREQGSTPHIPAREDRAA